MDASVYHSNRALAELNSTVRILVLANWIRAEISLESREFLPVILSLHTPQT